MTISVIIPTYNRCELLRRALLSVFAQTLLPTEIVVIDDGSSDGTQAMMRTEFPNVGYYYQENSGISSARNLGIQHTTGDWLAFLDADDEWLPEKLAKQTTALTTNPDSKICHTEELDCVTLEIAKNVFQWRFRLEFGWWSSDIETVFQSSS